MDLIACREHCSASGAKKLPGARRVGAALSLFLASMVACGTPVLASDLARTPWKVASAEPSLDGPQIVEEGHPIQTIRLRPNNQFKITESVQIEGFGGTLSSGSIVYRLDHRFPIYCTKLDREGEIFRSLNSRRRYGESEVCFNDQQADGYVESFFIAEDWSRYRNTWVRDELVLLPHPIAVQAADDSESGYTVPIYARLSRIDNRRRTARINLCLYPTYDDVPTFNAIDCLTPGLLVEQSESTTFSLFGARYAISELGRDGMVVTQVSGFTDEHIIIQTAD